MKTLGFLPGNFRDQSCVFWNIESLVVTQKENYATHIPITIGITRSFGMKRQSFIARKSMDSGDLKSLIGDFLDLLESFEKDFFHSFGSDFWEGWKKLKIEMDRPGLTPAAIAKLKAFRAKMASFFTCKIYGFNSERYDHLALKGALFDELLKRDPKNFSITMRGAGIMSISYKKFSFRDIRNFAPPGSLKKFAASFDVQTEKDVWPYRFYQKIDEIENAKNFPPIGVFENDGSKNKVSEFENLLGEFEDQNSILTYFGIFDPVLFQNPMEKWGNVEKSYLEDILKISPQNYFIAKNRFLGKIGSGEWKSMLDHLRFYNLNDCLVLQETWKRYCETFYSTYNVDVQG